MSKYTHKKIAAALAKKAAAQADEISPDQKGELKALGEGIRSLGRRTTKDSLELGGYLARAKSILPERQLGAWVKAICKFTPKTARNYIAIYENLSVYEDRLVEAAVAPTTLFVLAYADHQDVEQVLSAFEAGEQLTVARVKSMVGVAPAKKAASTDGALNVPGLAGLRKVAQLKVEQDTVQFVGLTTAILANVEMALEPLANKKRVHKEKLHKKIVFDCRHAHDLLNSIGAPLQPDVTDHMNWRAAKLPEGAGWRKVQDLLHRMGGSDSWAKGSAFVPWLQDEVVPLLRFVVHGEAIVEIEAHLIAETDVDETDTSEIEGLIPVEQLPPSVEEASEGVKSTSWYDRRNRMNSDQQTAERHAA